MLRTATNVIVEPFPDESASFVFLPEPFRILVINRRLAGVLQLFQRTDAAERSRLAAGATAGAGGAARAAQLRTAIERLIELELLEQVDA